MSRSKFEDKIKKVFKQNNVKFKYEGEKIQYIVEANYVPDFIFFNRKKQKIYVETKGWFRPEDRKKMLKVKICNPDLDIRLWFQKDNFLTKKKKKKYSDWAEQHDFVYHVGYTFPEHWL